jgi:hypothetical protein
MADELKKQRIAEIKKLLDAFCERHLNEEFKGYAHTLCEKTGRNRIISINKGKKEIWAAAIIYVIVRLNFLFDKESDYFITADIICDFFGTKKTTSSNKATQIEKACNIRIGEQGLCNSKITDMFTFYETPEGFILPKSMTNFSKITFNPIDGKASLKTQKKGHTAEKTPEKKDEDDKQLKLFDDH